MSSPPPTRTTTATTEMAQHNHCCEQHQLFTVAHIHAQHTCPARSIVLLRTTTDQAQDQYEVVQHRTTTVLDRDRHDVLLRGLQKLPTAASLPVAEPEMNIPDELDKGGYERASALLGKGMFGRVYRVTTKDPCSSTLARAQDRLCLGPGQRHHTQAVTMIQKEASTLKTLAGHCGIPRLWKVVVTQRAFSMEYCVGGTLEDAIKQAGKKRLPLAVCMEVFRQLLYAIQHAHKAGLLHRDVKPANILLRRKLTCTSTIYDVDVVLGDWGLAIATSERQGKGVVGTRRYLPPEVLSRELPFDTTCGVWAAGCVFAQLIRLDDAVGAPLFNGEFVSNWVERLKT